MKPNLCISVTVLLAMMLSGCEKDEKDGDETWPPYSDYFIRSYVDPPTQEMVEATVYPSVVEGEPNVPLNPIRLIFGYKQSVDLNWEQYPCWVISPEQTWLDRKAVCDSLAKAHHDTEYKRSGEVFGFCQFVRTDHIDVISDTDYDAAHPAGTPLNDIVDIQFFSAEDYLKSGYQKAMYLGETTCKPKSYNSFFKQYEFSTSVSYLQESLEEFNRLKRKLLYFDFRFLFRSDPVHTAEHTFTIVYRNEQGLTLTGQVGPVLLKGTE